MFLTWVRVMLINYLTLIHLEGILSKSVLKMMISALLEMKGVGCLLMLQQGMLIVNKV